jgi:hypothetical protein
LKGNLTWEERKIQREAINKYTGENMTDETAESLRSLFIGELNLHAKKEIDRQLQLMLSSNNFDGIDKLLRSIEPHIVNDVYFFYFAAKVKYIRKDWNGVKYWRERYVLVPDIQLRKKKSYSNKINHMFFIEMENRNEEFRNWNRKMFVIGGGNTFNTPSNC